MKSQLFLCFCLASVATFAIAEDLCHMERKEKCLSSFEKAWEANDKSIPGTEAEIKELCVELKKSRECLNAFAKDCSTPTQRELAALLAGGSQEVLEEFCTPNSELQTKFIEHAPCVKKEGYDSDEAKSFSTYVEAALESLKEKAPNQRLPLACCGYNFLRKNIYKTIEEKCGEDAVDVAEEVLERMVASLPHVFCHGFDPESPKCAEILPPRDSKPKGVLRNSLLAEKFKKLFINS